MTAILKGISLSFLGVLFSFAVTAESANARYKDPMEKGGEQQCMQQHGCFNMPKGPQRKACRKQCKRMVGPGGQVNPGAAPGAGGYGQPPMYGQQPMYGRPMY